MSFDKIRQPAQQALGSGERKKERGARETHAREVGPSSLACLSRAVRSFLRVTSKRLLHNLKIWPGLLEAWLVLTSVKYHGNLYILIPLNQRLALTRLRATGPRQLLVKMASLKFRWKEKKNPKNIYEIMGKTFREDPIQTLNLFDEAKKSL